MNKFVVIIGMGELGELFARGFLKLGYPVYPVLRSMQLSTVVSAIPEPELVLLAVGEEDLHSQLDILPEDWRDRLAFLQNELLPRDWHRHDIVDPTVIVVWFDKKKGRPFKALLPSYVSGPKADLITSSLQIIDVPCREISREQHLYEMIRKNLYILTVNIAGLKMSPGSTVSKLWADYREMTEILVKELLDIQEWLVQGKLPRDKLLAGMLEVFSADPEHICRGRTAPERLNRVLKFANIAGISVPMLQAISIEINE
jgi:hypothetical protein